MNFSFAVKKPSLRALVLCIMAALAGGVSTQVAAAQADTKLPILTLCGNFGQSVNETITKKAEVVSAIIDELSLERDRFLRTGEAADLFPAIYYHVTKKEFQFALEAPPELRAELLDTIILFYDSYRLNRDRFEANGKRAVESHVKRYYSQVSEFRRSRPKGVLSVMGLLLSAIDAHMIDLSRTIRYIRGIYPDSFGEFERSFDKMDPLFADAARLANEDIINGLQIAGTFTSFDRSFHLGETYIIHARHRAWEEAVAKGKLRAKSKQPVLEHKVGTRSNFDLNTSSADCR